MQDTVSEGRHHSDKTIALIKKKLQGQKRTPEQRQHYSRAKRGENSPSARLKTHQVREIRRRIIDREPYRSMVLEFGVTWQNIRAIDTRKTWKHLPLEMGETERWEGKGYHLDKMTGRWTRNEVKESVP